MSASPATRIAAAATLTVVAGMMPAFLFGSTAVLVRDDLDFSRSAVGVVVATYYASLAMASVPGGRLAERFGPRRALLVSLAGSAVSLAGLAFLTSSLPALVGWMFLAGIAGGFSMPASGLALVQGIEGRHGAMFGITQSSAPLASLLAGLAVPAVAVSLGWRATFGVALATIPVLVLLVPPAHRFTRPVPGRAGPAVGDRPPLVAGLVRLSFAAGMGSAAAVSMGSFLVESVSHFGYAASTGALLLAFGSLVGVVTRVLVGLRADRSSVRPLVRVGTMLATATIGYLAIGIGQPLAVVAVGVAVAYGFGHGWPGLLFYGVVSIHPHSPAMAIGTVNTGASVGAAVGPAIFGVIASRSIPGAWVFAAATALVGAALVLVVGGRMEARHAVAQSRPLDEQHGAGAVGAPALPEPPTV